MSVGKKINTKSIEEIQWEKQEQRIKSLEKRVETLEQYVRDLIDGKARLLSVECFR